MAALCGLSVLPSSAEISVTASTTVTDRTADFTFNFPANTADKLVVVVTGEHGFNNAAGMLNSLTYDDVELTQAVYRLPVVPQTDILYHGIWFLDNPSTSIGNIRVQATTRGTVSAFLLTGTAPGHGATGITPVGSRSISLTTTQTESMVFAAFAVGGNGNTGDTRSIDTDAPLVEVTAVRDPSNWQGHVVGTQTIPTPGDNTFSFTGGDATGGLVAAVEFLSADGNPGLPFAITDISFNPTTNEVTLTWPKTGASGFTAKVSPDLLDWNNDLDDGITELSDEDPDDEAQITVTLPLPNDLEGSTKLFFRVEEN